MSGLPEAWTTSAIGALCERLVDGSHNPPRPSAVGHPMLSARNVASRTINFEQARTIAEADFMVEHSRTNIAAGDVLLTIVGTIGRSAVVPAGFAPFAVQRSVAVLKPKSTEPRYLSYALQSPLTQQRMLDLASGTAQKGIYLKTLSSVELPVAPRAEQQRIADKLDAILARVDACRDRLDRVWPLLQRFRQSVLAAAVGGALTLDWRTQAGASNWSSCLIREAGKIQLGRQRSPKYHSGANMRPYLRVQNVFEDRIDLSDVMEMDFPGEDFERYQLLPGDILLNEGQSPRYLGRPAMYRGELPGACFTNSLIRFQPHAHVDGEFALLVFRHQMHAGRYVTEGTITTNIAHLSAGRFGAVEFPLPSLDEQREIVRQARRLLQWADVLDTRLQEAQRTVARLSPSVLAKAFRGELVPQDPNDEPAAEMLARLATSTAPKKTAKRGRSTA